MTKKLLCFITLMLALVCMLVSCGECKHAWSDPTCTYDACCEKCGETVGRGLGHSYSEWTESKKATLDADGVKERTCSRCNKTETLTVSLMDDLVEQGKHKLEEFHSTLKNHLLNPNSYTVNSDFGRIYRDRETSSIYLMISIDYSAQNLAGGYNRYENNKRYFVWNEAYSVWVQLYVPYDDVLITKIFDGEFEFVNIF